MFIARLQSEVGYGVSVPASIITSCGGEAQFGGVLVCPLTPVTSKLSAKYFIQRGWLSLGELQLLVGEPNFSNLVRLFGGGLFYE